MDCDGPKHALIRDIDGRFTSTSSGREGSIVPVAELRCASYACCSELWTKTLSSI